MTPSILTTIADGIQGICKDKGINFCTVSLNLSDEAYDTLCSRIDREDIGNQMIIYINGIKFDIYKI